MTVLLGSAVQSSKDQQLFRLDGRPRINAIVACGVVLLLADLGIMSTADAAVGALLMALLRPSLAPWLLFPLATIQDAPGLAGIWWYAGFVMVGAWSIVSCSNLRLAGKPRIWGLIASVIVVYAIFVSLIQDSLGGYPQSDHRNPMLVGGLVLFMIWCGLYVGQRLSLTPKNARTIKWVVALLVLHGLGVALIQAIYSPTFLASPVGLQEIKNAAQLIEPTAAGFPRITGTFLTPNGFALAMALLLLLVPAIRGTMVIKWQYAVAWISIGAILSLMSFSKALGIFFVLTAWIALFQLLHWKRALILFGSFMLVTWIGIVLWPTALSILADVLRITAEFSGDSFRAQAWSLTLSNFYWGDWLFGTGFSYWPVFFESRMDVTLADPHSWVLSVPGTFGLPGFMFYILVAYGLVRVMRRSSGEHWLIAAVMLVLLFIKDLVSVPSLLGNTPLTFLVWVIIGGLFSPRVLSAKQ